jgi:hypothetical protein
MSNDENTKNHRKRELSQEEGGLKFRILRNKEGDLNSSPSVVSVAKSTRL